MPRIYINFSGLSQIGDECKRISFKVDTIQSEFQNTVRQLDWDIKFASDINSTANQISRKLEEYSRILENYQNFLENTCSEYIKLESYQSIRTEEFTENASAVEEEKNISLEEKLSIWEKLLTGANKFEGNSEAGVLKEAVSYIRKFIAFFIGDKKGLTGASNYFDFAGASTGLWAAGYDYFQNIYDGLKTGFFGENAQKRVKGLDLSANIMGLCASIISLIDDSENNQLSDYWDCAENSASVVCSGYSLKNFGNVNSLDKMKVGPWSALNIWKAVVISGVQAVSQGFSSVKKYSADGKWDLADTGATGIDIAMAGIYGISHVLTYGCDDIAFGIADMVAGGNGNADMSYAEKAAEEYKNLAKKWGTDIGNWWISLNT